MSSSETKPSSSLYTRLSLDEDASGSGTSIEMRNSSSEHFAPLLEASENLTAPTPPVPFQLPKLILCFSFALALLSSANIVLLRTTLSKYQAYPLSAAELEGLPYGDARLGLDRVASFMAPPLSYHHAWPDRIVRVSRKLKTAVWGQGVQVYVTVEVSIARLQSTDSFSSLP